MSNKNLPEELHRPIIKIFEKRKVYSSFKDNIWDADLVDMQLISKFNKIFRFLLCVVEIWLEKGSEQFHNRSMKLFLQNNDIGMC